MLDLCSFLLLGRLGLQLMSQVGLEIKLELELGCTCGDLDSSWLRLGAIHLLMALIDTPLFGLQFSLRDRAICLTSARIPLSSLASLVTSLCKDLSTEPSPALDSVLPPLTSLEGEEEYPREEDALAREAE